MINRVSIAPSLTLSPAASISSIPSLRSGNGSASTVIIPASEDIPDATSTFSETLPSLSGQTRTTDDLAIRGGEVFISPQTTGQGTRVIAPSRSSSLRRTSSLTDLDVEFESAISEFPPVSPRTITSVFSSPRPLPLRPPASSYLSTRDSYATAKSTPFYSSKSSLSPTTPGGKSITFVSARSRPPSTVFSSPASDASRELFYSPQDRGPGRRIPGSQGKAGSVYSLTSVNEQERHRVATTEGTQTPATDEFGSTLSPGDTTPASYIPIPLSFRGTESGSLLGDSHMGLTSSSTSRPRSALDTKSLTPPPKSGSYYGTPVSRAARPLPSEPSSGSSSSSPSYSSAPSRPGRNISTTPSAPSKLSTVSSYDATTFVSASESSEAERTPTRTHFDSPSAFSRETTQQESVTETIRGPSPTETQGPEGSVGSTETERSDGQRSRLERADSFFSEARSARSLEPSTYSPIAYGVCMTSDISEFTPLSGSSPPASAPQLSRTITPTPSTRYTTASQPPRSHSSTSFTTASEPLTPSQKTESVYATAERTPSSSRPSTIAISPSTEYATAEVCPTTPYPSSGSPSISPSSVSTLPLTSAPSHVQTIRDVPSDWEPSIVGSSVPVSSELSATPTLSRTMSIASRSRTGTVLSGPARPSPARSVASRSSASYVPASTPSITSVSSIPESSAPRSVPSSKTPSQSSITSRTISTAQVFSTPNSGSFLLPPVPPPSSTQFLSPPAASPRSPSVSGRSLPATDVSTIISSSVLEQTPSIFSSVLPSELEHSMSSSVFEPTASVQTAESYVVARMPRSPSISVPSTLTASGLTVPTVSSRTPLARAPSTRSVNSSVLLPSRSSSLRSTTISARESVSCRLTVPLVNVLTGPSRRQYQRFSHRLSVSQ